MRQGAGWRRGIGSWRVDCNRERVGTNKHTKRGMTVAIVYPTESYRIMGACFEVYREMGCGFLEPVYQECLEIELALQDIAFVPQQRLKLSYKTRLLKQVYEPDFVCWEKIVVELKAVKAIDDGHRAQVHNYLKSTGYKLGLLVNFGHHPQVEYERIVV